MKDRFAVVGHPIDHSRSPEIHAAFADQFGLALEYVRIDASETAFAPTVRSFFDSGGRGLNITLPHKIAAFTLCDELSHRAQLAGAVNTLYRNDDRLSGENTDGVGLLRDVRRVLSEHGESLVLRSVLVLGSGGAARGVLAGLIGEGPSSITLAARNPKKTQELVAQFASAENIGCVDPEHESMDFDVVINATSAGVSGELPEVGMQYLRRARCAYDLGYAKGGLTTPFLRQARSVGVPIVADGLGMLVEQAAEAFYIWHGLRPATAEVLARLRGQ